MVVAIAGFDILRDSGHPFARRPEADAISVRCLNYPLLTRSFL
jgi:hypothetical protein